MNRTASDNAQRRPARRVPARGRGATSIPDAVFGATEQLLGEAPLRQLTVSRILARSHVSRTSFYYHFASKEAVLAAMLDQVADDVGRLVAPLLPRRLEGDLELAFRDALTATFALWERHRPILLVAQRDLRGDAALAARWRTLVEQRFVRPFAVRIADARPAEGRGDALRTPAPDPLATSRALHWMSEQALHAHIAGLDRTPVATVVDTHARIWSATLAR